MNPSELPTIHAGDHRQVIVSDDETAVDLTGGHASDAFSHALELDEGGAHDSALVLGRYRLGRRLGSGAFGLVYRARDERLDRDVAVKVLPRERVVFARFEREARAAARLQHPGVVTLYEAAVDDEGAYLVSELVRGKTLDALLDAGKLSDRDIIAIGVALCDALEHAHALGVIHRDVKPSNVLVPSRPGAAGSRAKLTDFGVAHVVGESALTRPGDVVGTVAYMSPEQANGREVGPETDLYSLALVLYEALVGVNPTQGHSGSVAPIRRARRDLSRDLAAAIDTALASRPQARGTLDQLRASLAMCLPVADEKPGIVAPAWGGSTETLPDESGGPEWRDSGLDSDRTDALRPPMLAPEPREPLPRWLPRGLNAAAAGLTTAWLAVHLLHSHLLTPAAIALIATTVVLLLPRLGWAAIVAAMTMLAIAAGYVAGALALLAVLVPGIVLLVFAPAGSALPGAAAALGVIGLAGAWPAIVARICPRLWQRSVVAAMGFICVVAASILWRRDLYWEPSGIAPAHVWTGSLDRAYHDVVVPLFATDALLGALVWAIVAAFLPLVIRGTRPALDLVMAMFASAVTVSAVQAVGAHNLHHAVIGAAAAVLISGGPAAVDLVRGLER